MKKILILTGLVLAAWAGAKVCDQRYHLQTANQFVLEGDSIGNLKPKAGGSILLNKSMSNAMLIHDSTQYKIVTDFDGSGTCTDWVAKSIDFAYRQRAVNHFTVLTETQNFVKLYDGAYPLASPGWDDYWFGFASSVHNDTALIFEAIGKLKSASQLHVWYGTATLKRTLTSPTGASRGTQTHYFRELTSHPDSAALQAILLNGWKGYINNDTEKVLFTVQMIKVNYDSVETPATRIAETKSRVGSGFQANQTGQIVLIQPGEKKVGPDEPLSLYGMMGNKIATLHPTGYMYQWNGKTSAGVDAPTGVYFVQSGNRILGKFFYSR